MDSSFRFNCVFCNYKTNRKKHFDRHIESISHLRISFLQHQELNYQELSEHAEEEMEIEPCIVVDDADYQTQSHRNSHSLMDNSTNTRNTEQETVPDEEWFPFESKTAMLLYCFMNSTTHNVSDEIVKYVIFMMEECGVDVPSFSSLKDMQFGGTKPEDFLSRGEDDDGKPFWIVKPSELVKLTLAHPDTAESLARFPRNNNTISQQADGKRWQELPINALNFAKRGVYRCDNLNSLVQVDFFADNVETDVLEAKVRKVVEGSNTQGLAERSLIICDTSCFVPVSSLTFLVNTIDEDIDIFQKVGDRIEQLSSKESRMFRSSFMRRVKPTISVPINLFVDDTSTNRSRRWKALHCFQMQAAGLPLSQRQRMNTIKFVGASDSVDCMSLAKLIIQDVETMRNGITAFDAKNKKECDVTSCINILIADYSMASYCSNHLGASAIKYCPRCNATADTFNHVDMPRQPADTLRAIQRINLRGSESRKKKLRKSTGVKEHPNYFWDVLNPHSDIPVGLLHLLPLGLVKHLVKSLLSEASQDTILKMKTMLNSMSGQDYFSFFENFQSRQGKDLKIYLQLAPLNLLLCNVDKKYVKMMSCLAKIQLVLHNDQFDEDDMSLFRSLIDQYMQYINRYLPELARKAKTHMLLHLVEDIFNHGPPKAYCEDGFEKTHGTIRNELFNQNQHARSRDLAVQFAKSAILDHIMSGGFVLDNNHIWRQASDNVLSCYATRVGKLLGQSQSQLKTAGEVTKITRTKGNRPVVEKLDDLEITQLGLDGQFTVIKGSAVTSKNNKIVNSGTWIKYTTENEECFAEFVEGLIISNQQTGKTLKMAKVVKGHILQEKLLGCITVARDSVFSYINSASIQSSVQLFHDCLNGHCTLVQENQSLNSEQETVLMKVLNIKHMSHNVYVINNFNLC